jgi:hypothetical protein
LKTALQAQMGDGRLDIGHCIALHWHFFFDASAGDYQFVEQSKPATAFLLKLIATLRFSGTVPMIDIEAYAQWPTKP